MPSSITPNMNLVVPTVGQEPGPQYATDVNASLNIIDGHNHTPGFGVPVPTDGLNINADLTFTDNRSLLLKSVTFTAQPSPLTGISPDIGAVYVSGVDLYYNDINGNQIRLTQNGSISGTAGSISGLTAPASASYNSGTSEFIWQSDVNTAASMDGGPVTIRQETANAHGITLQSPISLAADYSLTFMGALPSTTQILTVDSSGNIASNKAAANLALIFSGSVSGSAPAGSIALSPSSGAFSLTTITSPGPVTNLSVTITTLGRPVFVGLVYDNSVTNTASIGISSTVGGEGLGVLYILNGSTIIDNEELAIIASPSGGTVGNSIPASSLHIIDTSVSGSPGTYTYTVNAQLVVGSNLSVNYAKLIAYEI